MLKWATLLAAGGVAGCCGEPVLGGTGELARWAVCSRIWDEGAVARAGRYDAFLKRFGRDRGDVDCARLAAFAENEAIAERLNADPADSAEYSASHSPFGDLRAAEFVSTVLMPAQALSPALAARSGRSRAEGPSGVGVDWSSRAGIVSPPRDQGTLGTCYVFSAAGAVEGQLGLQHGLGNETLSVEQSLECNGRADKDSKNAVCGEFGGWPHLVFEFWKDTPFVRDRDWPYCAGLLDKSATPLCFPCMASDYDRTKCGDHADLFCNASSTEGQSARGRCRDRRWLGSAGLGRVSSWAAMPSNETALAGELERRGPLSVTMDASWLMLYRRGVANPRLCTKNSFNHSVLLVGFGLDRRTPFWKAKSSWGPKWGEQGYFRIFRGAERCGINRAAVSATVQTTRADLLAVAQ